MVADGADGVALSPAEVDEVWRRWRSGQAVKVLSGRCAGIPRQC
jgi:hypothetical protein